MVLCFCKFGVFKIGDIVVICIWGEVVRGEMKVFVVVFFCGYEVLVVVVVVLGILFLGVFVMKNFLLSGLCWGYKFIFVSWLFRVLIVLGFCFGGDVIFNLFVVFLYIIEVLKRNWWEFNVIGCNVEYFFMVFLIGVGFFRGVFFIFFLVVFKIGVNNVLLLWVFLDCGDFGLWKKVWGFL